MKKTVRKEKELKVKDRLLYEKIRELLISLPPGTPLPPVHWLKREYRTGYSALNRVLKALEAEGRIAIRKNKGIFALDANSAKEKDEVEEGAISIPWLSQAKSLAVICVQKYSGCEVWKKLVQNYNNRSPIQKFELSFIEDKKLKSTFGNEKDFDLAVFASHLNRRFHLLENNLFEMDRFISSFKPELQLYDEIWDRDRTAGPVTGAAPFISMTLMAYRKDVFKKKKISLSAYPLPGEILRAAELLKGDFENSAYVFLGYMSYFFRMGVSLLDDEGGGLTFKKADVKPVLDFLRDVSVKKKLSPFCSESYRIYSSEKKLLSLKSPLLECPVWSSFDETDYGFLPMPALKNGSEPLFTPLICIGRNTFYPEECWNFISYVLSGEGQEIIAESCMGLPAAKNILPSHLGTEKIEAMKNIVSRGRVVYRNSITLYEARFIIEMLIERWLKGLMSLEELCNEVESRCSRFISKFSNK